ncbi:uncharacterized protein BX663DRAFT_502407 [Cokeromyces recurvatus]|uniref:uncharacterized protein n=1 Tax=Cokeromyces recurvatus TaxID=90255 RepID=UPI00221F59C6|nr:uncharacterized protein BX663DRAFT_502407 [Cokeromyces recurvatus]KAI7905303.1 hypothetical protein BX663DRAFT_502407 [Cokeromyces recurvatus]
MNIDSAYMLISIFLTLMYIISHAFVTSTTCNLCNSLLFPYNTHTPILCLSKPNKTKITKFFKL